MAFDGFRWLSMAFDGFRWRLMAFDGFRWLSKAFDGFRWLSMGINGCVIDVESKTFMIKIVKDFNKQNLEWPEGARVS